MADHRNNPLISVPMQSGWEGERITLSRSSLGTGNPKTTGQAIAAALFHALTPAAFAALLTEAMRLTERTQP